MVSRGSHRLFYYDLSDRDYACVLLPDLDYEAQLYAIRDLLQCHMRADQLLCEEIKEIEAHVRQLSGIRNQQAVDEWVDRMHASVYQDAAHSMAAVGMLAPLVESIFHQAFLETRVYYVSHSMHLPSHPRCQEAGKDEWDCHFVWNNGRRNKNLVEGIFQLADAIGLTPHLPASIQPKLKALFVYRNKMFHHGFEWPVDERSKFVKLIQCERWPDTWFNAAISGGHPWIYYMTETYISDCVSVIEQIIDAIGCFARQLRSDWMAQQTNLADR